MDCHTYRTSLPSSSLHYQPWIAILTELLCPPLPYTINHGLLYLQNFFAIISLTLSTMDCHTYRTSLPLSTLHYQPWIAILTEFLCHYLPYTINHGLPYLQNFFAIIFLTLSTMDCHTYRTSLLSSPLHYQPSHKLGLFHATLQYNGLHKFRLLSL